MKRLNRFIKEDLGGALVEPKSNASDEARKLKLKYVGFGRYEDPTTGQVTHIVQNDKLMPISKAMKSNTFASQSGDDFGDYLKNLGTANQPDMSSHYPPEKFDDAELDAIRNFTGGLHLDINKKLASLPAGVATNAIPPQYVGDPVPQTVAALDSALNKIPTKQAMVVYCALGDGYKPEDFVPGRRFTIKGFRSTSTDASKAIALTPNDGQPERSTIVLQILVPPGSKGMFVDEFSATPGEGEFVLQRGSTAVVKNTSGQLVGSHAATSDTNLRVTYFDCELVVNK